MIKSKTKIIQHGPKIKLQWQIFTLTSVEQMVTMENPLMNYGKKTVGTGNMNDPKIQDKNGLLTKFQNMIFSII